MKLKDIKEQQVFWWPTERCFAVRIYNLDTNNLRYVKIGVGYSSWTYSLQLVDLMKEEVILVPKGTQLV